MPLAIGQRLGSYEVTAKLGEGGMGEVYRARDTKLDRDVAIKVLSAAFAGDAERLARFQREARTLAALNHPNIGGIYGLEESGGTTALVLEYIDGPTLADRILVTQLFGTTAVAVLLLLAADTGASSIRDVALVFALFGGVSLLAFVRQGPRPPGSGR